MSNHLFDALLRPDIAPARVCIRFLDGNVLTYGDLGDRSAQLANLLTALGVGVGDRVLVQVHKSPEVLFLYLACLRAGAVFVPANPDYTPPELEYLVGDAAPKLVICRPASMDVIPPIAERAGALVESLGAEGDGSLLAKARVAPSRFANVTRSPDDLAAILYTSGTTGRSKGAMLAHGNLRSNAEALVDAWRFTRDDVLIHALPVFHTHGLFVATNVTLMAGAAMIFLPKFDQEKVIALMLEATVLMGVPTYYVRLLQHPGLTKGAASAMRLFVSGSAPLLAETHREWRERTGQVILERYGMTETNMNTSNPYDGERRAGSVGMPLPGVSLRIADPATGVPCPTGEIGMIELKGTNVFSGYWRMPEKLRSDFRPDGYFISGDLGRIDADGYLHIVGRSKDLIISGGLNVYPKEVETEIDLIDGVTESAVFGVSHPDLGEGVTAAVTRNEGSAVSEDAIIAALRVRLAGFKVPKRVLFVDALPRNTLGKVQKNLLRHRYRDLYRPPSPASAASAPPPPPPSGA